MIYHFRLLVFPILLIAVISGEAMAKYNPELGRFMQRDPLGYVDGQGLTQYVSSNPIRFSDPSGLKLSVPGGSNEFRNRMSDALNKMCPEADIEIDGAGNLTVTNQSEIDCNTSDNPKGCECLLSAVNGNNNLKIYDKSSNSGIDAYRDLYRRSTNNAEPNLGDWYRRYPGGSTMLEPDDPSSRSIFLPSHYIDSRGRPDSSPGYLPGPQPDTGTVPVDDATTLAHELCGHGVGDYNSHDDLHEDDSYRHGRDPAVTIENGIRNEMDPYHYGIRDGNTGTWPGYWSFR